ncbi:hypothetical protein J2W34_006310 [Variovorax boronicumulans]|nr:hypothetical protein [Variovorax boronicumulans]MDQ0608105.1 hypothetical protein [Variovorax sp. W1I1]
MAYVGDGYVRSSLDLPIFEVSQPALVKPVTRIMSSASTWRAGRHGTGRGDLSHTCSLPSSMRE